MKKSAILLFTLLLAACAASANTATLAITGFPGPFAAPPGAIVGPYDATLNGTPLQVFCDDFIAHVAVGDSWQVNITPLNGNLSQTKFVNFGGLSLPTVTSMYDQIAWLTLQFAANPTANWAGIHSAIWSFFDPSVPTVPGMSSDPASTGYWIAQATANYSTINPANFVILTQTSVNQQGVTQYQEFIAATPEPGSFVLIGIGLIAVSTLARKRMAR